MHASCVQLEASRHVVSLLAKWSHLAAVQNDAQRASGTAPVEAAASRLLQETLQYVREAPMGEPSTVPPQRTEEGSELLGKRENSLLIWKTLRRHRVSWEATMALAHTQMQYLPSDEHRSFVMRRSDRRPWSVSRAVLAAWDWQSDAQLAEVYHALKETKTMVSFAQEVAKALRSRPQLHQVLPVPLSVLLHVYRLSLPPTRPTEGFRPSVSKERRTETVRMALEVCRRMALLGESSLSMSTKERLVLQHARLLRQCGEWDRVLQLVSASPAVRLSVKESVSKYVRERSFWQRALENVDASLIAEPTKATWVDPVKSVARAPHWLQALAVVERRFSHQPALLLSTWLARKDVPLPSVWETALQWVEKVPAGSVLTIESLVKVLRAIPSPPMPLDANKGASTENTPCASDYVEGAVRLLRPTTTQLRGGDLFSALRRCASTAKWWEALVLACASRSYDLAQGLSSHLRSNAEFPLPLEYVEFEKTMLTLRQPDAAAAAACQPSKDSSLPELLAHALCGNWRRVAQLPRAYTCNRLRSLLSAQHASSATESTNLGPVDCYVFADPKHTQLVYSSASAEKQTMFLAQLPSAVRSQYRCLVTSGGNTEDILEQSLITHEDCVQWCIATQKELVRAPVRPQALSVALLKCVADKAASGGVQMRSSERYGLALAVLEATASDHWRLDATTATRAFKSVPAMYVSASPAALTSGVRGVLGLAQWEVALQRYHLSAKVARMAQVDAASPKKDISSSSYPPSDAEKAKEAMWLDVCATIALVAPAEVAKRHARYLWRRYDHTLSLLTLELLHGDSRGVASELRTLTKGLEAVQAQRARPTNRTRSALMKRKENILTQKRKALVSAAFTLLNAETPLRFVVRAMRKRHVHATDMDTSALGKVLAVLPWEAALQTVAEAEQNACPVEETWLLSIAVRKELPCDRIVLERMAQFLPYASLLQAMLFVRASIAEKNLVSGLKGLLRVCHLVEQYPYPGPLRHPFALLLERFVETEWPQEKDIVRVNAIDASSTTTTNTTTTTNDGDNNNSHESAEELAKQMRLARLLFNRLLQVAKYTEKIRPGRTELAVSFKEPSPVSPLLLLHFLFCVVGRQERVPVRASLASRCLRMAQSHSPPDGGAALYFFRQLKRPTIEERMLLVRCLQDNDMAPTLLLNTHRFSQDGFVEQTVVWADVASASKWERSLCLLEMRRRQGEASAQRKGEGQGEGKVEKEKDAQEADRLEDRSLSHIKKLVWEEYISKWDGAECARVLELCRRAGYSVPDLTSNSQNVPLPPRKAQHPFASEIIECIQDRMRTVGRS